MVKNQGGRKFRVGYMIFSIAVSISLWLYVTKDLNPTRDWTVSKIPVVFDGEDLLGDNNYIVSARDTTELTITFNGRWQDVTKLTNTNVRAVVDLTDVLTQYTSPTGTHALEYDLEFDSPNANVTTVSASKHVIEVTVERMVTDVIRLEPVYEGSIAEGYMAGDLTLARESVEVAGTEAAISKIARATVTLRRDNLSKTAMDKAPIVFLDENGDTIDMAAEGLTFVNSDGTAVITQDILMVKRVPLVIDIVPSATASDANITIDIQPESIVLSGDPEVLEAVNTINLGTVDLQSIFMVYNNTYQIKIPNNTNNMNNTVMATVAINVVDSSLALRRLSATNIGCINRTETDYVTVITQSLDITLRGKESVLESVDPANIRIVADLTDQKKGTSSVPAKVYVDGYTDVEAVGDYHVTVTISDEPPEVEEPPEAPPGD